jgi:hypothetical protein
MAEIKLCDCVGKSVLVYPKSWGVGLEEWLILEVSPSKNCVHVQHENGHKQWIDLNPLIFYPRVVEVLERR